MMKKLSLALLSLGGFFSLMLNWCAADDRASDIAEVNPSGLTAEPWKATTVFATAGSKNKNKGDLFKIHVLRSPKGRSFVLYDNKPFEAIPQDGIVLDFDKMDPVELPANVQKILNLATNKADFDDYKVTTGWFDYSYTEPRSICTFFFGDAGDVFILQRSQGVDAQSIKVKHLFKSLEFNKCALDARGGKVPVLYTREINTKEDGPDITVGQFFGLVSLKDGRLRELGMARIAGDASAIKWLNDRQLCIVETTRKSSGWHIYDLLEQKVVAEGMSSLYQNDDMDLFLGDYIVRDSVLYGLQWNHICKRLYPPRQ